MTSGRLAGLRVVEFASIGPGPHCAMLLADLGADVLRIDRPNGNDQPNPVADRGRAILTLDIRSEAGRVKSLELIAQADVSIEGSRPGVMERLGLGPNDACSLNKRLIYARMTGWGQDGPLARMAGHDINYLALTSALAAVGKPGEPATVPLNLIGDFGGGSVFLAFGIMAALWERERSGLGQVVDAAIVDGVASIMSMFAGLVPSGRISLDREANMLGGAAPFYRCYLCKDGKEIAVGAIEPQFYSHLLAAVGAPAEWVKDQHDTTNWPDRCAWFAAKFLTKSRDEWANQIEGIDACFAPVLDFREAGQHPHMKSRGTYVDRDGFAHPAPAPRFSRTRATIPEDRAAEAMIADWASDKQAAAPRAL
ncbi:CaiB/BaiF CoA-transferase family protein [Novosphingobium sp. MD-1]|uniref:CaiB/BaiF CoA transferase family protein n=1 Tax=Novosphingobium sp. MD-1 TaxID=1630648 RepID=UPI000F7DF5F2|nr:CaiB/BaiF CoA-transferase family protein [Novosphingobium sp. MD-1]